MSRVEFRENYKNILDEYFWQFYRLNKTVRPLRYNSKIRSYKGVRDIFRTLQEMLSETTHGVILKDFGVIVPKDMLIEVNSGFFKKEYKIKNKYFFFFDKGWLSEYYRSYFKSISIYKTKENDVLRTPKPSSIKLHRKRIKKE